MALTIDNVLLSSSSNDVSSNNREQWMQSNSDDSWNYWWSYSGVSGPTYWGVLNLDWFMCDKGAKQSPINIETKNLIYDPHLKPLKVDNNLISGVLYNDGHAIVFNCSTMSLLLAQQQLIIIRAKDIENNNNNNSMNIIKTKRSINDNNNNNNNSTFDGLFSSFFNKLNKENSFYKQDENELKNSIDLSIRESNQVLSSSSLSLQANNELINDQETKAQNINNNDEINNDQEQQRNSFDELDKKQKLFISGANLVYTYRFEAIYLRFGNEFSDNNSQSNVGDGTLNIINPPPASGGGSEHKINSKSFSGELQLMAYNSILYKSYFEALTKPNGLIGISILLEEKTINNNSKNFENENEENDPLGILLKQVKEIKFRDESVIIRNFNLSALLSDLEHFVSYDGSITTPGCYETVNWLILNKPLYITKSNLNVLRSISADNEKSGTQTGTIIANNIRPIQATNNRPIRTNIRPTIGNNQNPETCQRLWTKYQYKQVE